MIPDKHVYGPLKNLMLVHAQTPGLVEQNEEAAVEFLVALCDKLGQFPGYVLAKFTASVDTFAERSCAHTSAMLIFLSRRSKTLRMYFFLR